MREVRSKFRSSLGLALFSERGRPTNHAWVFYDRVKEQTHRGNFHASTLLAYAIAHEIGHLLLGSNSHSSSGIMNAVWRRKELEKAEMGVLAFSEQEAGAMRALIIERCGL